MPRPPPKGRSRKVKSTPVKQKTKEKIAFAFKLFNRWESSAMVEDPGLKSYINLDAHILPRSAGTQRGRFHKSKTHIAERLALKLMVSGHTGKRHRVTSGRFAGNYSNVLSIVEQALEMVEKKQGTNPIPVLVKAIENASVREEVISYQLGSIMAREAVITAPQRRVDKTLRAFAQAAYRTSFQKKKSVAQALADEIIAAANNSSDSFAVKEKDRVEKEAMGAR